MRRAPLACPGALLPPATSRLSTPRALLPPATSRLSTRRGSFLREMSFQVDLRLFLLSLLTGNTTIRGVKDTVELNLLENDWSSVVQWMYHQLRKGKCCVGVPPKVSPPSLISSNDCTHVLVFWQNASKEEYEGILRIFLCHLDGQCLKIQKDIHSLPVDHTTVSFTWAMHLTYRCLGSRLFLLSFIECIAAKLAYLELSNVFMLTRENTV